MTFTFLNITMGNYLISVEQEKFENIFSVKVYKIYESGNGREIFKKYYKTYRGSVKKAYDLAQAAENNKL